MVVKCFGEGGGGKQGGIHMYQLQKRYEILHFSPECIYVLLITDTQTTNYFLTEC